VRRRKVLLLASLRFEHAADPDSARLVRGYCVASLESAKGRPAAGVSAEEHAETVAMASRSVAKLLDAATPPLAFQLRGVDINDQKAVDAAIVRAARTAWDTAERDGRLLEDPGPAYAADAAEVTMAKNHVISKCPCCSRRVLDFCQGDAGTFYFGKRHSPDFVLAPLELEQHVKRVWNNEREVCELVFGLKGRSVRAGADPFNHSMFFVSSVLVTPARLRPSSNLTVTGTSAEHPQNIFYQRILQLIEDLVAMQQEEAAGANASEDDYDASEAAHTGAAAAIARKKLLASASRKETSAKAILDMQRALMDLYDSPGGDAMKNGGAMGIRQQLESKQGLFRMHMMGKRVNFSCRSVIGPDAFLDTNEVGIPESFAKLLTIPETVTPHNLARMQAAVRNGPDVYPGANAVEDWTRNGALQIVKFRSSKNRRLLEAQAKLLVRNAHQRNSLNAKQPRSSIGGDGNGDESAIDGENLSGVGDDAVLPKRVLRHLRDGDIVLFNRQPTLHRVSMMAHKVRVLPGDRTIRFHYANCQSYNADFDGDEMNVHVPQDDIARSEAIQLMLCDNHYIAPTSGAPIRNLIQDHIIATSLITNRDTFLRRDVFANLLYSATERIMSGEHHSSATRYVLPTPAIVKPHRMWTGKQLISAVLDTVRAGRPGISLESRSRLKSSIVGVEEAQVLFRSGELLRGVLDKSAFGASSFGIVHAVQEAYGSHAAGAFLSAVSRLSTYFLRRHGHTTGVDDLMLLESADKERVETLVARVGQVGEEAAKSVREVFSREDGVASEKTRRVTGASKRKGALVELKAEDAAIALEANDVAAPLGFERTRSLVATMVRSKGAIAEDRLDAAMTGRLNAVASDVNRSIPSGLIKRYPLNGFSLMTETGAKGSAVNSTQISCLLGSTIMEGRRVPRMGGSGATLPCFAPFDPSPNAGGFIASRFLTGITPYEFFFHTMAGREGLLDTSLKTANSGYLQRCLVKHLEGIRMQYDYTTRDSDGSVLQMLYGDDGIDPCKASWLTNKLEWQVENIDALSELQGFSAEHLPKEDKEVAVLKAKLRVAPGVADGATLLEQASPCALARFGVSSETFYGKVEDALSHVKPEDRKRVEAFLHWRYLRGSAEPGDGVGVVAAQSVGEPSTQMTLNTFHHAGSESKHVTLGIPRLRELLMTAAKYPKTPSMTLPVLPHLGEQGAKDMSRLLVNVSLVDLLEMISIRESGVFYSPELGDVAVHKYGIVLSFPDEALYATELGFDFKFILQQVEDRFVPKLQAHFEKELRTLAQTDSLTKTKVKATDLHSASSIAALVAGGSGGMTPVSGSAEASTEVEAAGRDGGENGSENGSDRAVANEGLQKTDKRNRRRAGSGGDPLIEDGASDDDMDEIGDVGSDVGSDMDDFADMDANDRLEAAEMDSNGDGDANKGQGDGEAGGAEEEVSSAEKVRLWREAKRAELERKSMAKTKGKYRLTATASMDPNDTVAAKSKVPRVVETNRKAVTPSSAHQGGNAIEVDKCGDAGEETKVMLTSSSGMVGEAIVSGKRTVELPWILPHEVTGRVRVAELVREAACGIKLAFTDRIMKCFTEETPVDGQTRYAVATEGSNLAAVLDLGDGLIDMNNITTNDMVGILQCYGVEAMRSALVTEFKKIFDAYGIAVDLRHLSLIADYMTKLGGYRGFNRGAMTAVPSTFQQMSFETTMRFMSDAALCGRSDTVFPGPSAAISVGELYTGGTGAFELLSSV
jgi:DNA-directed RNA polymerase I subunit RPA1